MQEAMTPTTHQHHPVSTTPTMKCSVSEYEEKKEEITEARNSLLKVLLEHQFRPKFSSTPLDFPSSGNHIEPERNEQLIPTMEALDFSRFESSESEEGDGDQRLSSFTVSERKFLEEVLRSGDPERILAVEAALKDPTLFPDMREQAPSPAPDQEDSQRQSVVTRRNSLMQQRLFQIHQEGAVKPSDFLQRMSFLQHRNSILEESFEDTPIPDRPEAISSLPIQTTFSADSILASEEATDNGESEAVTTSQSEWNFFEGDLPSWLDGNQGVEVDGTGEPLMPHERSATQTDGPFRILGTSAYDASCHPHVLSPPLMEALLNFVPETLSTHNFWLKYSLVRDGANLLTMLRHVRSSTATLLAIETTQGHVFGSFTPDAWRLAQGWYGTREAFLWKMRRLRSQSPATTPASIYRQAMQESEIQVYPYRTGSMAVQYCSKECIMLGRGEVLQPNQKSGKHYGNGLYLEADLLKGSTSTTETFGNPCLVDDTLRGSRFQVSNLEVWTLTPHTTINEAQLSEFAALFLEGGREKKDLNLLGILVGGTI